jgi:hypothetical protein
MLPIFLAFGYVYTTFRFYCLAAPLITLPILILASLFQSNPGSSSGQCLSSPLDQRNNEVRYYYSFSRPLYS